jgi:hypothetical protein
MGTTTYDKLSRGRKQEIDLKRREDLKKAKDMPDSRVSDTVVDIAGGVSRLVGGPAAGMARAGYEAGRKDRERKAQDKADYKDLKEKPTKLFRDKNVKGMSDDELAKVGDFKVEKNKTGGKVKGYKTGGSPGMHRMPDGRMMKDSEHKGMMGGGKVKGYGMARGGKVCKMV